MVKSEKEVEEEDFRIKLPQANTEDKGNLKGKKKQKFDEIKSDLYRHLEGDEGSSANVSNDDGSVDVPQQIVAHTDSTLTNTHLSGSSLSKGPGVDMHENLQHADFSELAEDMQETSDKSDEHTNVLRGRGLPNNNDGKMIQAFIAKEVIKQVKV